jgi:SAM-dependent methyltransferase/glycosyltransferase involved in cell wall biosynthesis
MFDLEFTGERVIPGKVEDELLLEHVSRYRFAASYVADREVLDFGCGSGYGAAILKRAGARKVVGSDLTPEAVRFAHSHYAGPGLGFCVADCERCCFPDHSFDAVVSFELIEHLQSYPEFLAEVRRVLRPGGVFVLSTPNKRTYRTHPGIPPNPFHVHEFDLDEFRGVLESLFPAVVIFGQSRTEGVYFHRPPDQSLPDSRIRLAADEDDPAADDPLSYASFFVALCGDDGATFGAPVESSVFHVAETDGMQRRDQRIQQLQEELEGHAGWARGLEEESSRRGQRVLELQKELEERTRWAQELNHDAEARARRIRELEREVAELSQSAALADLEREQQQHRERRERRISELEHELERLGKRLREVESGFDSEITGVRADLEGPVQDLAGLEDRLGRRVEEIRQGLRAEVAQLRAALEDRGLEERLGRRTQQIERGFDSELAGLRSELEQRRQQEAERTETLRWHRDSLIRQQQELEGVRQRLADAAHRDAENAGLVERERQRVDGLVHTVDGLGQTVNGLGQTVGGIGHSVDGLGQTVGGLGQTVGGLGHTVAGLATTVDTLTHRLDLQRVEIARWIAQARQIERSADRSRHLVDLLWDSRSWRLYTRLRRFFRLPGTSERRPAKGDAPVTVRRTLIVDHRLPTPDQDAGSIRMVELMRLLLDLGIQVTFVPDNLHAMEPYTSQLRKLGVEVIVRPAVTSVTDWLTEYGAGFERAIVSRLHIATGCIDSVRRLCPNARLVFDTVDLQHLRLLRKAEVKGGAARRARAERARADELAVAARADATLVVSEVEHELLARELPGLSVRCMSLIHRTTDQVPGFEPRKGFYFVGGYEHPPNVDAVVWFANEVLPEVRRELPGVPFYLVGSKAPDEVRALAGDTVTVCGHVDDMRPYLQGCRLSIAPLRWGAGIKGKVTQSLAAGLPCVVSTVAAEGIGLTHGTDAMIADEAADFARCVVQLYRDHELWQRVSAGGRRKVEERFSPQVARRELEGLFDDLGLVPPR